MKFMIIQNPYFKGFDDLTFTIVLDKIYGYVLYKDKTLFEKIKENIKENINDIDLYVSDIKLKNADIQNLYDDELNDYISIRYNVTNLHKYMIGKQDFKIHGNDDDMYIVFDIYIVDPIKNVYDVIKHTLIEAFKTYNSEIEKEYIMLQTVKTKIEIINIDEYTDHEIL